MNSSVIVFFFSEISTSPTTPYTTSTTDNKTTGILFPTTSRFTVTTLFLQKLKQLYINTQ